MAKPYPGYTPEQSATIRQALIYKGDDLMLPTVDWSRLLRAIDNTMRIGYGLTGTHVLYPDEVTQRFARFTAALDAVGQAHLDLGERLQFHLDSHISTTEVNSFEQLLTAIGTVRLAANRATQTVRHTSPVRRNGAPKNLVMRWVVGKLLEVFETATGIPPRAYASQHSRDGYAGNFYPFAKACLAPFVLVPSKSLGSAILTGYKESKHREISKSKKFPPTV